MCDIRPPFESLKGLGFQVTNLSNKEIRKAINKLNNNLVNLKLKKIKITKMKAKDPTYIKQIIKEEAGKN